EGGAASGGRHYGRVVHGCNGHGYGGSGRTTVAIRNSVGKGRRAVEISARRKADAGSGERHRSVGGLRYGRYRQRLRVRRARVISQHE
nr:hypothetical protein [Tanacetum cinerariifolium]